MKKCAAGAKKLHTNHKIHFFALKNMMKLLKIQKFRSYHTTFARHMNVSKAKFSKILLASYGKKKATPLKKVLCNCLKIGLNKQKTIKTRIL